MVETVNVFSTPIIFITIGAALLCAFTPYVRKIFVWFTTIMHEMGHAFFSLITGGGITGIKLHLNGSGVTHTTHTVGTAWFTRKIVLFAGYATPIYLGISIIYFSYKGYSQVMFYILVGVAALTLIFIRNIAGLLITLLYIGALLAVSFIQQGAYEMVAVFFFGVILFVRGVWDLIMAGYMVFTMPAHGEDSPGTDFHILNSESALRIPAKAWYVSYILINIVILSLIFVNM